MVPQYSQLLFIPTHIHSSKLHAFLFGSVVVSHLSLTDGNESRMRPDQFLRNLPVIGISFVIMSWLKRRFPGIHMDWTSNIFKFYQKRTPQPAMQTSRCVCGSCPKIKNNYLSLSVGALLY